MGQSKLKSSSDKSLEIVSYKRKRKEVIDSYLRLVVSQ